MIMELSCKDCKFYLPVDVFSGICKISKAKILPDDAFCSKGEKMPKCRECRNYKAETEHLGKCRGTILAYPDMVAQHCEEFAWYHQK